MPPNDRNGAEREERLNGILVSWLEAAETGQVPDEQEFLGRYPEFAPELTKHLANWKRFAPITDPPRPQPIPSSGGRGDGSMASVPSDTALNGPAPSALGADLSTPPDGSTKQSLSPPRRAHAAEEGQGRSFGDYELLEEIGRGGMGVVYKARQKGPNRLVALKMVQAGRWLSEADVQRFRNEGELVARLDHPHLVPIYELGQRPAGDVGPPVLYFSMKLMEGGSLATAVAGGQWPAASKDQQRRAAQLLVPIARAIHHAHQRGVLHRDLKPSNILLDAEGRPHVTDFGLAKQVLIFGDHAADPSLTETGAIVGTPPYMSPEQAAGKRGTITTATDVYGLGTILYALLTGRPPFHEETPLETLAQVKDREPAQPSGINPRLDRDLETICLKCLEKEPARRYGSAEALAEDLERWLAGEPIVARPLSRAARAWRWCRRNPILAGMSGAIVLLLAFGVVALAVGYVAVSRARQTAEGHRIDAETRAATLRRQLYAAGMVLAFRHWDRAESSELRASLDQFRDAPDLQGFEWHWLNAQAQATPREVLTYRGHQGVIYSAAFSPDGKTVATCGEDRAIRLWDSTTGVARVLRPNPSTASLPIKGHKEDENGARFSPDGKLLASACEDGTVRLWDLATGTWQPLPPGHKGEVHGLDFSPDGRLLVTAGDDRVIRLWDVAGRSLRAELPGHTAPVTKVAFGPNGQDLVSADKNGWGKVWDLAGRRPRTSLHCGDQIFGVAFSPDGTRLATADRTGAVRVWLSETGKELDTLGRHPGHARYVHFSPDGRLLASCADDGSLRIWSAADGERRTYFKAHENCVWCVRFSPDSRRLVTVSTDRTAKVWELVVPPPVHWAATRGIPATQVVFAPKGRRLALATGDGRILLGDAGSQGPLATLPLRAAAEASLCFSPDAQWLAFVAVDGAIRGWHLAERREQLLVPVRRPPAGPQGEPLRGWGKVALAFTPDCRLAALYADKVIKLWDGGRLSDQRLPPSLDLGATPRMALAPDGKTLAVYDEGAVLVRLGELDSWQAATEVPCPASASALSFSPDGRLLAVGSYDGTIRIEPLTMGKERMILVGPRFPITAVAFAPDGRTLASAGNDGTVRLWHMDTGQELFVLENRQGRPVKSLAFSADGQVLAVAGEPDAAGSTVSLYYAAPATTNEGK